MTAILNEITQNYHAATIGWYSSLFTVSNHLFGILAVIEIAWSGLWWAVEKQEMTSLLSEFIKKILTIGFFYSLLLHAHTLLPMIIQGFMLLGANTAHINQLDPSSIFGQGISIAGAVFLPLQKLNFLTHANAYFVASVTSFVVCFSFAMIAGELVITLIESYFVLSAGIIFLGLGSSHWTRDYSLRFINYAVNVGCKLFFLYLIVGVGSNMAAHWAEIITTASNFNLVPYLEVLGASLVYLYIVWTVPHKASSLMSGSVHSNLSNAVSTITMLQSSVHTVSSNLRRFIPDIRQLKTYFNQKKSR